MSVQAKESKIHCVRPSVTCVEEPGLAEGCSQLGLMSQSSPGWGFLPLALGVGRIEGPAQSVSGEGPHSGLQVAVFCPPQWREGPLSSSPHKGADPTMGTPPSYLILMLSTSQSFHLIGVLGFNIWIFEGEKAQTFIPEEESYMNISFIAYSKVSHTYTMAVYIGNYLKIFIGIITGVQR